MTKPAATKSYAARTPGQVIAEQKLAAERAAKATVQKKPESNGGTAVAAARSTAVAPPDNRSMIEQYLDLVAPSSIVGRMVKFDKNGQFVTNDDGQQIPEGDEFIALVDQVLVGRIKFVEDGPPVRVSPITGRPTMGLLYSGFAPPTDDELDERDEALWEIGLDGKPSDPWRHQNYLVLQHTDSAAMYTFVTSSPTGRRAVGNLIRHFERMKKAKPGEFPVVKLRPGGFMHKDERVGFVPVPTFVVVGRAPADSAVKPDTSLGGDMNDSIGF
jgi:hypothetical protein